MMQSWTVSWARWTLDKLQHTILCATQGRIATVKASEAFNRYQSALLCFINAVASCDSNPDTPNIVESLVKGLEKVLEDKSSANLSFALL
jgi:hypothetical protein